MANKYIIIPDYKPLYAMRYCFGPTHGPLEKPCPTPIDVIGKLLLQSGNEKLNIFEVKVDPKTHKTIGEPVKLTLSNYKQPYEKIAAGKVAEADVGEKVTKDIKNDPVIVTPTQKKEEDSVVVTPKKEEPLVETTLEEKLKSIPEVEPDEIDEKMIQEYESTKENSDYISLDDFKTTLDVENTPVKTVDTKTVTVTTSADSEGTFSTSTVEYETPVEVPFTSGYMAPVDEEVVTDYVTTTNNSELVTLETETYKIPVTTSSGTKYIDTGMTKSAYKNLSKSKRRELRKKLTSEEGNDITDEEATEIENNTPILSTFEPSDERKKDYTL